MDRTAHTATLLTVVAALTLASASPAQAQRRADEPPPYRMAEELEDPKVVAILLNPLGVALNLIMGSVNIVPQLLVYITDYVGLDLMAGGVYWFDNPNDLAMWGLSLAAGPRISPLGTGLEGLYITPRLLATHQRQDGERVHNRNTSLGGVAEVGYTWIWGYFVLNLGGVLGYQATVAGEDIWAQFELGGLVLGANGSVGLAF